MTASLKLAPKPEYDEMKRKKRRKGKKVVVVVVVAHRRRHTFQEEEEEEREGGNWERKHEVKWNEQKEDKLKQ